MGKKKTSKSTADTSKKKAKVEKEEVNAPDVEEVEDPITPEEENVETPEEVDELDGVETPEEEIEEEDDGLPLIDPNNPIYDPDVPVTAKDKLGNAIDRPFVIKVLKEDERGTAYLCELSNEQKKYIPKKIFGKNGV